jgi:hypothetical protein
MTLLFSSSSSSPTQVYENADLYPYQKFIYALMSSESKRQYPKRLQFFLDYLQIKDLTIKVKSNSFYGLIKERGISWLEGELIKFFTVQNQSGKKRNIDRDNKELS